MKKLILGMLASCFILAASVTQSKAQVSLNVNIGTWTPPPAYSDVEYYYLPDVESYYYAPRHQYVYLDRGNWVFRNSLPDRYRGYNINNGYKVAVDRPQAYRYFNTDRSRYAQYRGSNRQVIVRGNSDNGYRNDNGNDNRRGADKHGNDNGHDNGNRGNEKGHGGGHDNGHGNKD
jgi:hypothetical protein